METFIPLRLIMKIDDITEILIMIRGGIFYDY